MAYASCYGRLYDDPYDDPYEEIITQKLLQRTKSQEKSSKSISIVVLDNGEVNFERYFGNFCNSETIYISRNKHVLSSAYETEGAINMKPKMIIHDDFEWLEKNLSALKSELSGQWVAVFNRQLIAHNNSLKEVYKIAKEKGCKRPFVTRIPQ